jgi:hypothetical protein
MSAVERRIEEEGFQPDTVISALINVAVATAFHMHAFHMHERTSQEANELIRLVAASIGAGQDHKVDCGTRS